VLRVEAQVRIDLESYLVAFVTQPSR